MTSPWTKASGQSLAAFGLAIGLFVLAAPAEARKTNQAVYVDPFDLGAGGANLTRASKEGRIFANPALMPYGGSFHRWLGLTTTVLTNKESVDTARQMMSNAQSSDSSASNDETTDPAADPANEEASGDSGQSSEFVDKVLHDPVRAGWGAALSWVTNNFGLSVFSRFEADVRAREYGATGMPEVTFQGESYHGVALGGALRSPWRWLSFGLTGKYLYVSEPEVSADLTDQAQIQKFADPAFIQDLKAHNVGTGVDAGMLLFFQGRALDLSIAGKVDDLGNTKLTGDSPSPGEFKQVTSAGVGVTLHTGADALHMAVDYRDMGNAYEEEMFKKLYAGTKLTLRGYLGLSAGIYDGNPSYGAEVDLILLRVAGTYYTRELGDHPGVDPRRIYMVSISMGY